MTAQGVLGIIVIIVSVGVVVHSVNDSTSPWLLLSWVGALLGGVSVGVSYGYMRGRVDEAKQLLPPSVR